jgi:hypothetical protein
MMGWLTSSEKIIWCVECNIATLQKTKMAKLKIKTSTGWVVERGY